MSRRIGEAFSSGECQSDVFPSDLLGQTSQTPKCTNITQIVIFENLSILNFMSETTVINDTTDRSVYVAKKKKKMKMKIYSQQQNK